MRTRLQAPRVCRAVFDLIQQRAKPCQVLQRGGFAEPVQIGALKIPGERMLAGERSSFRETVGRAKKFGNPGIVRAARQRAVGADRAVRVQDAARQFRRDLTDLAEPAHQRGAINSLFDPVLRSV